LTDFQEISPEIRAIEVALPTEFLQLTAEHINCAHISFVNCRVSLPAFTSPDVWSAGLVG
jgi:hypothetical protein